MPKREDAVAAKPATSNAAKAAAPQVAQIAQVGIDQSELLLTEQEMMDMETSVLVEILQNVYRIDPKSEPGVNSNKKVRTMILMAQGERISTGKSIPTAILAYKKKSAGTADVVMNPAPAAPAMVATVEQKMVRTVAYEVAATINTNNYENVKVSARVELPINPTEQDLADAAETMHKARELVFGQINSEINVVRSTMTNK
jgi:negative regulator of replication initiation